MSEQFIPGPDAQARTFMQTFGDTLVSDPPRYGVTAGDAALAKTVADEFASAYVIAVDENTRTPVAIALKDFKRQAAEDVIRLLAQQIRQNAAVSDEDKQALDIKPITNIRTPLPPPATNPVLEFMGTTPDGSHTIKFKDSLAETRGKPFGVQAIQIWRIIADTPILDSTTAQFYASYTRSPISVGFRAADNGRFCTYFARWINEKSEVGPWGPTISAPIATIVGLAA